jgi:hypothetical protein
MRTAEYVVFTLWPPGPLEQNVSTRRSFGSILMSTSSASGRTATVAVEVWMRPLASVTGTRCTRWTPLCGAGAATGLPPTVAMTSSPPTPVSWLDGFDFPTAPLA